MCADYLPTGPINIVSSSTENDTNPKIVALGGGHGLYVSLKAMRLLTTELTALVTVADDGGSSGRIRDERPDLLPPGDLRMALAALCDDDVWGKTWRNTMQYRFNTSDELNGHSLGNLLIVALWDQLGDPIEGLRWAARLLEAKGEVLPMSIEPLHIEGDLVHNGEVTTVKGQNALAKAPGKIKDLRIEPKNAKIPDQVLKTIAEAEYIIVGPGSLYTSVLPHFLLPELKQALIDSKAKLCFTMNINLADDETSGMKAGDHLGVLGEIASGVDFDYIIVNKDSIEDVAGFEKEVAAIGAEVVADRLSHSSHSEVHDPLRLAAIYKEIFTKDSKQGVNK
ncbi:MAG: uridine diphosphate-N-acetylglucosamine-binding protein YvcK [Micrococcaceae bacterium]